MWMHILMRTMQTSYGKVGEHEKPVRAGSKRKRSGADVEPKGSGSARQPANIAKFQIHQKLLLMTLILMKHAANKAGWKPVTI